MPSWRKRVRAFMSPPGDEPETFETRLERLEQALRAALDESGDSTDADADSETFVVTEEQWRQLTQSLEDLSQGLGSLRQVVRTFDLEEWNRRLVAVEAFEARIAALESRWVDGSSHCNHHDELEAGIKALETLLGRELDDDGVPCLGVIEALRERLPDPDDDDADGDALAQAGGDAVVADDGEDSSTLLILGVGGIIILLLVFLIFL